MYRLFEVNALFDQWIEILKSNELNTCSYNDFVDLSKVKDISIKELV